MSDPAFKLLFQWFCKFMLYSSCDSHTSDGVSCDYAPLDALNLSHSGYWSETRKKCISNVTMSESKITV